LTAFNHRLGPLDDDFDIAVIYGDPKRRGLCMQVLFPELMAPVCAPAAIAADGPLRPGDLRNHRLLLNMPDGSDWRAWAEENGVPDLPLNRALIFEVDDPAIQAAVAGHGIALANVRFVENELRAGALAIAVSTPPTEVGKYYVAYPEHLGDESILVSFRDWLLVEAATYHGG
jgi:LysR family glycine cleavage system transcriptional activator